MIKPKLIHSVAITIIRALRLTLLVLTTPRPTNTRDLSDYLKTFGAEKLLIGGVGCL
jgi:hypothetical protein